MRRRSSLWARWWLCKISNNRSSLPRFAPPTVSSPTNPPPPVSPYDQGAPRVTLELLELFVSVAQAGTIALAARNLHMVPSVATRKIAALEAALRARLFDRTTRRIHLTEAGILALEWAKAVLGGHERLADELSALQDQPSGLLRLVVNEYVGTVLLPAFLEGFSLRYPQIRYVVTMADALVTPENRDYDVAVHSGRVPDSGLMGVRIRTVQRVLCASPGYLARRGTPQRLEELASHDCLVHSQNAGGAWVFLRDGKVIRQPINQLLLANSYLPLLEFARRGMGIVRLSQTAVRDDLAAGRLVRVLPEFANVYPDGELPGMWILYPEGRQMQRTRLFVAELSVYLRELG